ncbi:hypothetical protein H5410_046665 [Solanum commersonii]|uniref:Uncharacterized protein n=1 Tax=Solanum commersonii TaxID=4109 RepID=A0A9J5XF24_SOLCO|nr:hypothetical protein H5410_046665 [Solanum commersonii]
MESKIAYLNVELVVVAEREKKREEERGGDCSSKGGREQEERDENEKSDKESEGDENGKFDKESEGDEDPNTQPNESNCIAIANYRNKVNELKVELNELDIIERGLCNPTSGTEETAMKKNLGIRYEI